MRKLPLDHTIPTDDDDGEDCIREIVADVLTDVFKRLRGTAITLRATGREEWADTIDVVASALADEVFNDTPQPDEGGGR